MANILICDDEQDIVNALKIYLNDPDYVLFEAHNGKEAVETVRSPCVIVETVVVVTFCIVTAVDVTVVIVALRVVRVTVAVVQAVVVV